VRDQSLYTALQYFIMFVSLVLQCWLGIGATIAYFKVARGEAVVFGDVVSGGRFVWRIVIASILFGLIVAGALLIPVIFAALVIFPMMRAGPTVSGVIMFLVSCGFAVGLFLVIFARLMPFYYLIIDRNARIVGSLQVAWQMTSGRAATIVLIVFGQFAIILAGFLAFCVGLIFALPFVSLLQVVTYLALSGSATVELEPVPEPELETDAWEEDL
jgi:hypothetical protein